MTAWKDLCCHSKNKDVASEWMLSGATAPLLQTILCSFFFFFTELNVPVLL